MSPRCRSPPAKGVVARSSSRPPLPDTPAVSMAPGGATGAEINGSASFGTTRAQLSWRSWPSRQNGPIPLETFVPHAERREAGSRRGKQRVSRDSHMADRRHDQELHRNRRRVQPPGTVGILSPVNPRHEIWPI